MNIEDWDQIKYFNPEEFTYPEKMDFLFMLKLDNARRLARVPFVINSSVRIGETEASHKRGLAVDIACTSSRPRYKIITSLLANGFKRIGVYDKHIHVDMDYTLDDEVIWWGVSK